MKKQIGVIGIPRDLWVEAPGLEPGRINTVVKLGNRKFGTPKGVGLLKHVIKRELGIAIDHVIIADFSGFVTIVDDLEGIPVKVVCPIEDCFHSNKTDAGCDMLSLAAGEHVLDGETALKFARSRHGRTDIDRARRQQAVLVGLKKRLARPVTIPRLPSLWKRLTQYVQTDIDAAAALRIGLLLASVDRSALHGMVLGPPMVASTKTSDGKQVFMLQRDETRNALSALFHSPMPGKRTGGVCPAPDVGMHWRERLEKAASVKQTASSSQAGASTGTLQ